MGSGADPAPGWRFPSCPSLPSHPSLGPRFPSIPPPLDALPVPLTSSLCFPGSSSYFLGTFWFFSPIPSPFVISSTIISSLSTHLLILAASSFLSAAFGAESCPAPPTQPHQPQHPPDTLTGCRMLVLVLSAGSQRVPDRAAHGHGSLPVPVEALFKAGSCHCSLAN